MLRSPRRPLPVPAATVFLILASFASVVPIRTAGTAAASKPLKVVVLGDSYSSGTGAGDEAHGPQGCYRSRQHDPKREPRNQSWLSLYLNGLAGKGFNPITDNRACYGAIVRDLTSGQMRDTFPITSGSCTKSMWPGEQFIPVDGVGRPVPPIPEFPAFACKRALARQLDAVNKDTDLVLFTISGNDFGFEFIVKQCFGLHNEGECRRLVASAKEIIEGGRPVDPDNDPRTDDGYFFPEELHSLLKALRKQGPEDMKVVFISYPYLERNDSFRVASFAAGKEISSFAAGKEIRAAQRDLDEKQFKILQGVYRDALKASQCVIGGSTCLLASNAVYLDTVKQAFVGHEPDARWGEENPNSWLHELFRSGRNFFGGCWPSARHECYHPNTGGHDAISKLLLPFDAFNAGGGASPLRGSIDLVLVIDSTGSMSDDIDAVKAYASEFVDRVAAESKTFRVGLVTYRDFPERTGTRTDYVSRIDLSFSDNKAAILAAITAIGLGDGGDDPETVYSGVKTAIDFPWRVGVKKVIVQFGDAAPLDPEPVTGLRAAEISAAARAVDPAVVYPVSVSSMGSVAPGLREIATATGGRVLSSPSPREVDSVLTQIITEAGSAPFAWAGGPYITRVGTALALDSRGSFDDGTIVSYEWDLDGNGVYDVTMGAPELVHTFSREFAGIIGLRVTDDRGLKAESTTPVVVSRDGDVVPAEIDKCPELDNPGQEDFDGDGVGDECDEAAGFPVASVRPRTGGSPDGVVIALTVLVSLGVVVGVVALLSGRSAPPWFCDQCGTRHAHPAAFCDRCGTAVGAPTRGGPTGAARQP